jgi:O-antigen/teichoic acid export membrane protein
MQRKLPELTYLAAVLANPAIHLLSIAVSIRYLSPEDMGILANCALIPLYLAFTHLGVFSGLARELPFARGRGDQVAATHLEYASLAFAWRIATVLAVAISTIGLTVVAIAATPLTGWAIAATGLVVWNQLIAAHVDVALRGRNEFSKLASILWTTNLINLATVPLIAQGGMLGAVIRLATTSVASIAIKMVLYDKKPRLTLDIAPLKHLARTGAPLLASGALFSVLVASDRTLVALTMPKDAAGQFALGALILQGFQVIPQSLSMVYFPRMAQHFGQDREKSGLRPYLIQNLIFNAVTLIPISCITYSSLQWIIPNYFPKYLPGLEAAKVSCLTAMLWVYLGSGSVFGVTGHMRGYLTGLAASIGVVYIVGGAAILAGFGLMGAAWARFVGTALTASYTLYSAFRMTKPLVTPSSDAHP